MSATPFTPKITAENDVFLFGAAASAPEPVADVPQPDAEGKFATPADGAKFMASLGIPQVPLSKPSDTTFSNPGKNPAINGKGWQEKASTDFAQIDKWTKRFPSCNFGSVAKQQAGGFYVLETDSAELSSKYETETGRGLDALLVIESSALNRNHRWYAHSKDSLTELRNIGQEDAVGFSLRCDNEQCVSPGSIHQTGKQYRIVRASTPAAQPLEEIRWLKAQKSSASTRTAPPSGEKKLIPPGGHHAALLKELGSLINRGYSKAAAEKALLLWANEWLENPSHKTPIQDHIRAMVDSTDNWERGKPGANPTAKAKPSQKAAENPLAKDTARMATLTRGDGVKVRKVPWLWKGRLVAEGLNGFSGEPGCGKSTMGADIIAHVTRGLDFPDGAVNTNGPKDVLIICDEDGREDTIVPRLILAGADMTHIWFMDIEIHKGQTVEQAETRLDEDLPLIEQKLRENPRIVLVVPDPVTEYFGDANPNSDQEVGPIYSKMLQVSKRCHVAWLLISHFNKDRQATSTNRNSGAKVMVTRPRCNWLFAADPHSTDDRFLMLRGKCNLATHKTMAFYIGTQNVTLDVDGESLTLENITHIRWDGETDDKADDVLLCMADPKDHASTKVKAFLDDLLAEGPVRAKAAYDAGLVQRINPDMFHKYGRGISRSQIPTAADGTNEWWWARTKLELDDLRSRTISKQPADPVSDDGVLTFLQGMIGDAAMPVSVLKSAAKARGLNWETVRTAHRRHGYESVSTEQGRCWRKRLSADNTPVPEEGEDDHAL